MADVDQFSSTTEIDQSSITENPNGAIQVSKPSKIVLGDFESNYGNWSPSSQNNDGSANIGRVSSRAYNGDISVEMDVDNASGSGTTGLCELTRTADLSGVETFSIWYYLVKEDSYEATTEVKLNGNVVYADYDDGALVQDQWTELEIDASSYGESTDITIAHGGYGGAGSFASTLFLDYIGIFKNQRTTANGSGGTV